MIKKTAKSLVSSEIDFTEDFNKNKNILGRTMPSKKIRNQVAGYLVRLKRQENEKKMSEQSNNF